MGNQNDRALILVDGLDQRGAAVDVEMVGRLIHDKQVRTAEGRQPHQQPRFLAAGQFGDARIGLAAGKADAGAAGPDLRQGRTAHQRGDVAVGRTGCIEIVDLMLGEEADIEPRRAPHCRRLMADQA